MNKFLFLGLGNPGDSYAETRHNAGWLALDQLIELWSDHSIPPVWKYEKKLEGHLLKLNHAGCDLLFLKPDTFMNDSGRSAAAATKWFFDHDPVESPDASLRQVVVFHDDLDLTLGTYKLQFNSGPKVHNGVNSVRQHLHTTAFWTARLGVDDRQGDRSMPGQAYVLQRLNAEARRALSQAIQTLSEELPYTVLQ